MIGGGGGAASEEVPGPETTLYDADWRAANPKGTRGAKSMAYPLPPGYQYGFSVLLRIPTPYTSERGGYPGWGLGVTGSDVVHLRFAYCWFH